MTESDDDMVVICLVPIELAAWNEETYKDVAYCLMDKTGAGSVCNRALNYMFRVEDIAPTNDQEYIFAAVRRGDLPKLAQNPETIVQMDVSETPRS